MTKDELLNQVSTSQIYEKFYQGEYTTKKNVKSPFSEDKNPSFRFYKNGTFKCQSNGNQGDAFQFVADLNQLDCKTQFSEILAIIGQEFSINGFSSNNHFSYETKPFEEIHLNYFAQGNWNVSQKVLEKYQVFALDKFEFWNSKKEEITKIKLFRNVIGFSYKINSNAEIYIPKQEKAKKFFLNKLAPGDVFGLAQLPKKPKQIIICAGKKDCLILNSNGFPAVTFRSENHFITQQQIDQLKAISSNLFICYDNDLAGINFSKQIQEKYKLNNIALPSEINDVADFFLKFTKVDFERIITNSIPVIEAKQVEEFQDLEAQNYGSTIFHIAERYLSKHYLFRFNTILLDVEYKKIAAKEWKICNEDSLFIEMQKKGINIQMAKLISILKSDFVKEYNPIVSYFKNLPKWNKKTDYINNLCNYITTPTPEEFSYHLKKWMARSVKTMLVKGYFNKQAFIITDKGNGQNIGKSHFTKWLCPPTLPLNRSFEDSKKDNLIKLATNAFIILDELDGISRKDLNGLKSLFAMDEIRVRLPYARREETVQRTANFIGSTNEENFLTDPTGSVRWLVFHVSNLDWNYSKKLDVNKLWSQAFALAFDPEFDEKFNKEDVKKNEIRNQTYQIRSSEAEMISLLYEFPNEKNQHKILFLTSTEILIFIKSNSSLNRLSSVGVGRALKLLGYQRIKKTGVYGYLICPTNKVLGVANNSF